MKGICKKSTFTKLTQYNQANFVTGIVDHPRRDVPGQRRSHQSVQRRDSLFLGRLRDHVQQVPRRPGRIHPGTSSGPPSSNRSRSVSSRALKVAMYDVPPLRLFRLAALCRPGRPDRRRGRPERLFRGISRAVRRHPEPAHL
ncbi:MAG: hypothetical protein MZU97_13085 [Bacillus subtilis]|nr:hypothetical protein [Bacillus subtilis]